MRYEEGTVYFYTGTGNSYRVAVWMAGAIRDAGGPATVRPIESARPSEEIGCGSSALLALVMPTHGFTTPWAMLKFAVHLPRRSGTHAVVVATRAGSRIGSAFFPGFEGTATALVGLVLALKGYRARGMVGIDMPSNWIALHSGLCADTVAGLVARAKERTASFMDAILSGGRSLTSWALILLGLLFLPLSLAYLLIGRFYLSKLFFASNACTGCGLCAQRCPNGAIKMRGTGTRRPYWTFHCQSCMRCMAYCPTQAVEASHLLAVGIYLLAGAVPTRAALAWLTGLVPALAVLRLAPGWVIVSVNAIVLLGLAYPLFHLALQIGWVNRFFTIATLTNYYRRYHEPETTIEDLE